MFKSISYVIKEIVQISIVFSVSQNMNYCQICEILNLVFLELCISSYSSVHILVSLWDCLGKKSTNIQRYYCRIFAMACCSIQCMVVYSPMHCRWMFCRIFKDKRHHKNEVSGVSFTSNDLFKRTIQSLCDVNYHIRYFDFKWMVSKSKLALDSILYVLRIYAWRSNFTCIICTHNVMA